MKKQFLFTMVLAIGLVGFNQAIAVTYSTDFSSDPGWITDQPQNYYWDSAIQAYHIRSENNSPALGLNRYFYKLLPEPVGSFVLQWDMKITYDDWSSGVAFGLWDSSFSDMSVPGGQTIYFVMGPADGGRYMAFVVKGPGGQAEASALSYSVNQWYTIVLSYDACANTVDCKVIIRDTGETVWTADTLSVPGGSFTNELRYLGGTRRTGYNGTYPGLSRWAVAEGYIDNVVLSVVPEPAIPVGIDIKPGSYPNAINLSSQGLTPVAILSEIGFDARTVNPATVSLSGALVAMRGKDKYMSHKEDVNKDGLVDLVVQVVTCDIDPGKLQQDGDVIYAVLTGNTVDGKAIEGEDEITIVPGEK